VNQEREEGYLSTARLRLSRVIERDAGEREVVEGLAMPIFMQYHSILDLMPEIRARPAYDVFLDITGTRKLSGVARHTRVDVDNGDLFVVMVDKLG
jgi:hypothetical protein